MKTQTRGGGISPIGPALQNGQDIGGARFYPFSAGLAISPPAMYSTYIGSGMGLPVSPPTSSLPTTTGVPMGAGGGPAVANATGHPWGRYSPLPWVIAGLFGAVFVMHELHYKDAKGA